MIPATKPPFRILVIRYRFVGDTVMAIPFLRNLRAAHPDAQIDVLVEPVSGDVLADCPYKNELIYWYRRKKIPLTETRPACHGVFGAARYLRQRRYDKTYILRRSFSSSLVAFLARIPERIGFDTQRRGFLLTRPVPYVHTRHEVEMFLDLLRADGVPVIDTRNGNHAPAETLLRIDALMPAHAGPRVLLCPCSVKPGKEWPVHHFSRLVEWLTNERNFQVHFAGSPADVATHRRIMEGVGAPLRTPPVDWSERLDLREAAALISRMNLAVGIDTGLLHIAASFLVPVIALFGPMNPACWHPWGTRHTVLQSNRPCVPCEFAYQCPYDYACMKQDLSVCHVEGAIDAMVGENR